MCVCYIKSVHSSCCAVWQASFYNSVLSVYRLTCRCFRGSCCTVPDWPSRTQPSTWPSMSSFSWTPAPRPRWTPLNSCWMLMRTARDGHQTGGFPRSSLYPMFSSDSNLGLEDIGLIFLAFPSQCGCSGSFSVSLLFELMHKSLWGCPHPHEQLLYSTDASWANTRQ